MPPQAETHTIFDPMEEAFSGRSCQEQPGNTDLTLIYPLFLFDWLSLPVLSLIIIIQCIFFHNLCSIDRIYGPDLCVCLGRRRTCWSNNNNNNKQKKAPTYPRKVHFRTWLLWIMDLWLPLGALKGLKWGGKKLISLSGEWMKSGLSTDTALRAAVRPGVLLPRGRLGALKAPVRMSELDSSWEGNLKTLSGDSSAAQSNTVQGGSQPTAISFSILENR